MLVRDHAIANGMMMRATGDTMILSPPLIWTRATIDMAADRIATARSTWQNATFASECEGAPETGAPPKGELT